MHVHGSNSMVVSLIVIRSKRSFLSVVNCADGCTLRGHPRESRRKNRARRGFVVPEVVPSYNVYNTLEHHCTYLRCYNNDLYML